MKFRHKGSVFIKRKLFVSFFILSMTTFISKFFSIINRMILSRMMSEEALKLYLFLMPTLSLCLTLGQLGIPSAIYRLLTHPKYNKSKVIIASLIISLFSTCILTLSLFVLLPTICTNLLKNTNAYYPMLTFLLFIPLVSLSGILKNILLAKNHLFIVTKTQIVEELSRIGFCVLIFSYTSIKTDLFFVIIAYLSMSIGEFVSIVYMLFIILRKYKLNASIKTEKETYTTLLSIALPLTGSRLMHSFVSFLEPIILLSGRIQLPAAIIQNQYAIISGFVLSLLSTPFFFNTIIYRIYQPIANDDLYYHRPSTLKHLIYAMISGILIGLPFSCLFYFFPAQAIQLIYHTTSGSILVKKLAFPFLIFYIQTPLTVILYSANKNRILFIIAFIECSLELIMTYTLSPIMGVKAIIVSLYAGLLISLIISLYYVIHIIHKNTKQP